MTIVVNIDKAKLIGHDIRRKLRDKEFSPLDELIMKQIPGTDFDSIELQRQAIRDKYSVIQEEINTSQTPEEIKSALGIE